ncbi:glycosyltransferase family 2 protein [Paludibaculum fermentans]|uniref:Glycosyltransferase family 2 protein n=1 Tax=Paludibaculum fermentans TaxID=1473598 RepID=A0A7S7SJ15_PALFE|nr:glycosyltransferase family A protein [Paludibaculum fermentans]QOY86046.1 glycosyltransferase family 2 protein [Paludibaculum fermentans]
MNPFTVSRLHARPLVSVLVANHNYERWLGRALESLLAQTYPHWEAIVCDDGSSDDSRAIIAAYASRHARIRLVTQANAGMASALNTAFGGVRGELVALLDSDDEWLPGRLQAVVDRFYVTQQVGMVTHLVRAVHAGGQLLKPIHPRRLDSGWLAPSILSGREPGLPPCSGLTFHAEVARRIFPLPVHFRRCADKIAQDRAALLAPVSAIHWPLSLYRIHGANLTGLSGPCTLAALESNFEFLEQLWADRRAFVLAQHGFLPDSAPWRDIESAHLQLAHRLFTREPGAADYLSALPSSVQRQAWRLLLALPAPAAQAALRLWWSENAVKRVFRNSWDLLRQPA